ncbi:MAG: FadR family transcriptional regulator [Desulfobacter sp.]|nr:MAG: FadR family transcriptional regulator [Desulfobacter sp.]
MLTQFEPVKTDSLKEVCVKRFEEMILSGKLSPGQKLPPERELALQLGVSRPVIHKALLDIASKGLVSLKPRIGTIVNDYRKDGSLALLNSLVNYHHGRLESKLLESLLDMRVLFEIENARLAARNRTDAQALEIRQLVREERKTAIADTRRLAELDFEFHLLIAISTANMGYPLLLNSFKQVYTNLTGTFFSRPEEYPVVLGFHRELAASVEVRDEDRAARVMGRLLDHGRTVLTDIFSRKGDG